jgi:pyruvate dehydrogenase E2 component (dihydrolipoamide acetyltransferase)
MSEVTMPRLSDTMEEGELARWVKNVGDQVEKGEVIAEIETDKATMDLEAFESGVLEKQLVEEGTIVPIGQAVAVIGDGSASQDEPGSGGGEESAGQSDSDAEQGTEEDTVAAEAEDETESDELDEEDLEESEEPGQPAESPQPAAESAADEPAPNEPAGEEKAADQSAGSDKLRMSPLARKLAHDNDIDLEAVKGTGPQGRIIRADIDAAIEAKGTAEEAPAKEPATETPRSSR